MRSNLPKDTKLYKLLLKCKVKHELHMLEAHDGALIMECVDCPFHHVLELKEEYEVRKQMTEDYPHR